MKKTKLIRSIVAIIAAMAVLTAGALTMGGTFAMPSAIQWVAPVPTENPTAKILTYREANPDEELSSILGTVNVKSSDENKLHATVSPNNIVTATARAVPGLVSVAAVSKVGMVRLYNYIIKNPTDYICSYTLKADEVELNPTTASMNTTLKLTDLFSDLTEAQFNTIQWTSSNESVFRVILDRLNFPNQDETAPDYIYSDYTYIMSNTATSGSAILNGTFKDCYGQNQTISILFTVK